MNQAPPSLPPESHFTQNSPILGANPTPPPSGISQGKLIVLLLGIVLAFAVGLALVLLNGLRKLPFPVNFIAGSIWTVFAGIIAIWGVIALILPKNIQQLIESLSNKAKLALISATIIILAIATLVPFLVTVPTSSQSTIVDETPIATPAPTNWKPILTQKAPNCNNLQGEEWLVYARGTQNSCGTSGSLMRQISSHTYAEMDLTKVKGTNYNQIKFQVKVHVTFQNPGDSSTWAALFVQTPAAAGVPGGYIFALSPTGDCQLQNVSTAQDIPIVERGTVTNLNLHQSITMTVVVQDGVLYGFVNGQVVLSHPDTLDASPRDVGLIVERAKAAPSSWVQFSNFELDN